MMQALLLAAGLFMFLAGFVGQSRPLLATGLSAAGVICLWAVNIRFMDFNVATGWRARDGQLDTIALWSFTVDNDINGQLPIYTASPAGLLPACSVFTAILNGKKALVFESGEVEMV